MGRISPTLKRCYVAAAWTSTADDLRETLKNYPDLPFWRGAEGMTALHGAAKAGNIPALRLLVENGAEPDARDAEARTPLMLAAQYAGPAVIDLLLDWGANAEVTDGAGCRVIDYARMSDRPQENADCVSSYPARQAEQKRAEKTARCRSAGRAPFEGTAKPMNVRRIRLKI